MPRIDDGSGSGLSFETLLTPKADLAILANWQAAYGVGGLGEFIGLTSSRNIAAGRLPRPGGMMNAEAIMAENPQVYIATSSPGGKYSGFAVGPGVSAEEARRTLAASVDTPVMASIAAVRSGRVHGLWNFFNPSR